jgi:hypothetical protein
VCCLAQPTFRAQAQGLVGRAWLRTGAEQDVADDERLLLGQPKDDLGGARRPKGLDSAGEVVAAAERVSNADAAVAQRLGRSCRRPDVLRVDVLRRPPVPVDGDEHVVGRP